MRKAMATIQSPGVEGHSPGLKNLPRALKKEPRMGMFMMVLIVSICPQNSLFSIQLYGPSKGLIILGNFDHLRLCPGHL